MEKTTDSKAVLFIRVSTREQAEEGYSLEAQRKLLQVYADKKSLVVDRVFEISESASGKQERKHFCETMDYLEKHTSVSNLVCEKIDRITRNRKDAVRVDDWLEEDERRKIHFVKQSLVVHENSSSNEKLQWDISLAMASNYSNNLSEETKKGLYERAEQGFYPGNNKRGYKTTGEVGRKMWVVDDLSTESLYIKKAFELYDSGGHTLRTVSRTLGSEGWKSKDGRIISVATLHNILSDCFYCGEFNFGSKHSSNAKHEPLITKDLFYRVQDRLKRKIKAGKYRKHNFAFGGGLLVCGECGRSVTGDLQKEHHYYHCTRYKTDCTQKTFVREERIEELLTNILNGLQVKNEKLSAWIQKAIKESHKDEMDYQSRATASLDSEYTKVRSRLDAAYDDKLDGLITKEQYESVRMRYEEQLKNIVKAKEAHTYSGIDYLRFGMNIFELSQKSSQLFEKRATAEEKRQILNFIFSNLQLKDGNLVPTYHNGFELVANRAKTGNWLGDRDSNPSIQVQNLTSYH